MTVGAKEEPEELWKVSEAVRNLEFLFGPGRYPSYIKEWETIKRAALAWQMQKIAERASEKTVEDNQ